MKIDDIEESDNIDYDDLKEKTESVWKKINLRTKTLQEMTLK
jgi:hypothetical protein